GSGARSRRRARRASRRKPTSSSTSACSRRAAPASTRNCAAEKGSGPFSLPLRSLEKGVLTPFLAQAAQARLPEDARALREERTRHAVLEVAEGRALERILSQHVGEMPSSHQGKMP